MTRSPAESERTSEDLGRPRLARGVSYDLVIDTSDSAERWQELIDSIEQLARQGETIDCSRRKAKLQHASVPRRASRGN